jgi:hypothetical protein
MLADRADETDACHAAYFNLCDINYQLHHTHQLTSAILVFMLINVA